MLVATNLLVRMLQPHHELALLAKNPINKIRLESRLLYLMPQNLVELWVVATRPIAQNGLGLSIPEAASELTRLKDMFSLLPDTAAIYPTWERLVKQYQVAGKLAHDAWLVAAMEVHGLTAILNFDKAGFSGYAGIEVVHPAEVTA